MRPLRIMQIIDSLKYGGAEILLRDIAASLKELDQEVMVCYCTEGPLSQDLSAMGIPVKKLSRMGRIDPGLLLRMYIEIRKFKPDIVHTHLFKSDIHGRFAARLAGVPVVISTLHNNDRWAVRFPLGWLYGLTARFADRIVAVSKNVGQYHLRHTSLSAEKLVIIENGVDQAKFTLQEAAGLKVRREFQIKDGEHLIGIIGRLQPQKDHVNFLKAAARLKSMMPDVRFLIVGDGELRDDILRLISELRLEDNVIVAGPRSDIPAVLKALNLLVISSQWEGLPVVLLESWAARIPVVATAVGGIPLAADGGEAYLVPANDPIALATACFDILNDKERRDRMIDAGYEKVARHYSLKAMILRLLDLYRDQMEKSGKI